MELFNVLTRDSKKPPRPTRFRRFAVLLYAAFVCATSTFWAPSTFAATQVVELNGVWRIKLDPTNEGKTADWNAKPLDETSEIPVPGVIQQVFPDYHGVAWFERSFATPTNPNADGRVLLRFWQVEYYCDVWLNGKLIGSHEGGEAAFELDATDALAPVGSENRLTVRVINVTDEPIEDFSLATVPSRNNTNKITAGCGYASGGIVDSVELLLAPQVRIADLHLIPNWKTGEIVVESTFDNASPTPRRGTLTLGAALATGNETTAPASFSITVEPGATVVEQTICVPDFKLWNLNDPNLYNVFAEWRADDSNAANDASNADGTLVAAEGSVERRVARSGFRDFRFENGYFRLNGKRIYLKCSHSGSDSPITHRLPLDPDLFRKDILFCKAMNFNAIRYIAGMPRRFQLDLCDELGFMVYDECLAGWLLAESPFRRERLYRQTEGMILRDRNHPCVTMWGLLNEEPGAANVLDAAAFLPRLRELDPDRIVFLNSGSFDKFVPGQGVKKEANFSVWRRANETLMPAVVKNLGLDGFYYDGTNWRGRTLALHPGDVANEYAALKWTAPKDGEFALAARFFDIVVDGVATVDISIYLNKERVYNGFLNLNDFGKEASFDSTFNLKRGDALTFVVGIGDDKGTGDTTATEIKITADDGTIYDANADYSFERNPNGVWSFGYLKPGATPDLDSFALFDLGQERYNGATKTFGRIANPGSAVWEDLLADTHPYQAVPQTIEVINNLRSHNPAEGRPVFLSEYGVGSGVDLARLTRLFEQYGAVNSADAKHYRWRYDQFLEDWNAWNLDDTFASDEDFFRRTLAWSAEQRRIGINALRANPLVVAHSVTGTHDQGISGEGLTTIFREFKPGTVEALADVFAPLRFCLFVEPVGVYRGQATRFEAVLVNEDVLKPGTYPVRYQIVGPNNVRVFDKTTELVVPEPKPGAENPFSIPVFSEDVVVDGPSGEYKFVATFLKNAAACGGWERFFVVDKEDMPRLENKSFVVWGNDADLLERLRKVGIDAVPFVAADGSRAPLNPGTVVIVGAANDLANADEFARLFAAVEKGTNVLFLSPRVFGDGASANAFSPFEKLEVPSIQGGNWLYHKDDWTKRSPFFANLPSGDVLDYCFYREIVPAETFRTTPQPDEAVAGAFNTTQNYGGGLSFAVYRRGSGRFVLTTFRIRESLGVDPAAEFLLRDALFELGK